MTKDSLCLKCDKELKAQKQAEEKAKAEQVAAMVAARKAKEEAEKQIENAGLFQNWISDFLQKKQILE